MELVLSEMPVRPVDAEQATAEVGDGEIKFRGIRCRWYLKSWQCMVSRRE